MLFFKDEEEADKILKWLEREINDVWEKRDEIEPSYEGTPKPKVIEILKLLPRNCKEYGQPTCMVFATQLAGGAKGPEDCPELGDDQRGGLRSYLSQFKLDIL